MPLRILSCLLLFAAGFEAAASDLYSVINRLRAGAGDCIASEKLPPLQPQAALERVARELSQGGELKSSLTSAGYRVTRANTLAIKGDGVGAQAGQILARQSYCKPLQDAEMQAVGIYQDASQVWIVLAAPFVPAVSVSLQEAGQRVLQLVNQARSAPRQCGNKTFNAAQPLRWNETLAQASRLHAEDMARHNYFSHGGRDGSKPEQRVERAGYAYRATGENIAAGQMRPEDAVAVWIKSPPHCANLMNPAYTEMGVAFAVDSGSDMGVYWAQSFGRPR